MFFIGLHGGKAGLGRLSDVYMYICGPIGENELDEPALTNVLLAANLIKPSSTSWLILYPQIFKLMLSRKDIK